MAKIDCANCGRRIDAVRAPSGEVYLRATPPKVTLTLDEGDAEALLTLLEPSSPDDEHVDLYDRILALVMANRRRLAPAVKAAR